MATSETAPRRYQRRSLFRSVRWLQRNVVVGICLWLVFLGGLYLPRWLWLLHGRRPPFFSRLICFFSSVSCCPIPPGSSEEGLLVRFAFLAGNRQNAERVCYCCANDAVFIDAQCGRELRLEAHAGQSPTAPSQWVDFADRVGSQVAVILAIVAVTLGPLIEVFIAWFALQRAAMRLPCRPVHLFTVRLVWGQPLIYPAGMVQTCSRAGPRGHL